MDDCRFKGSQRCAGALGLVGWGGEPPHLGGVALLFWESRAAGLPHCWPWSSSKSSHPAGLQEWAERQLATDTALQRTRTRRGSQRRGWERKGAPGGGPGAEQDACCRGRQGSPQGLLITTLLLAGPSQHAERHRALCLISVCLSLSRALGKISRESLTRASLNHPLKHISHYRTKTFLCIEPESLQLDLNPDSTCCQSRWKRQSSHLPKTPAHYLLLSPSTPRVCSLSLPQPLKVPELT